MRKNKSIGNYFIFTIFFAIIVSFFVPGCTKNEQNSFPQAAQPVADEDVIIPVATEKPLVAPLVLSKNSDFVEIREKMFMTQINDVYLNADDYLGKTIKLEGIFMKEQYHVWDEPYFYVLRYGPGCCGYDGNVGFEVKWDAGIAKPYPNDDAWVEATGVLQFYKEGQAQYLYLDLSSLTELDKRGVEFVTQ